MTTTQNDLKYIKQALERSSGSPGFAFPYYLWGAIVFFGYLTAELSIDWLSVYWLVAAPLGMLISFWAGSRYSRNLGQQDKLLARKYLFHFTLMLVFIFSAVATQQYQAILLIIGLGYCLAGVHLERMMLYVGLITLAAYFLVMQGIIASNLVLGSVLALGLFICGWSLSSTTTAKKDASTIE